MTRIDPNDWRPIGVVDLEPAAWSALRATRSLCVTAGPGAGKTEFLAQRAAYLLQTGLCAPPAQILAISFKKDAATNLKARVAERCSPEHASRFRSLTFDAFTKGLLDRFVKTVPQQWRPTRPYEITFPKQIEIKDFLQTLLFEAPPRWSSYISGVRSSSFEQECLGSCRLPTVAREPLTAAEFVVFSWWRSRLDVERTSALTFVMINRLAELLIRSNAHVRRALRLTYPYVFLDEFQDTTYAQYDFLLTAFRETRSVLTAVGDQKQRIMGWAGARSDAFSQMMLDFHAENVSLLMNYRSSADLVKIQHVVAQALDSSTGAMTSAKERLISDEVAQIWVFRSREEEARHLAGWVGADMQERSLTPRDYALLVRQRTDQYEGQLAGAFNAAGIGIRDEARRVGKTSLQDLLAEELVRVIAAVIRLVVETKAPASWQLAIEALYRLRDVPDDDSPEAHRVAEEVPRFIEKTRALIKQQKPAEESAVAFVQHVFEFLDINSFRRAYREYASGDSVEIISEAFVEHFGNCAVKAGSWKDCIDACEGIGQVPLMTVHKSKGLEYDTTIFVGLDDDAWWSHSPGNPDGLATFFVALSRAKQRAVFTYCVGLGRRKVNDLYSLLSSAGVKEYKF